jgi:hypothetical protein
MALLQCNSALFAGQNWGTNRTQDSAILFCPWLRLGGSKSQTEREQMRQTVEFAKVLVALLPALMMNPSVQAETTNLDATDHGWYDGAGEHFPDNVNYLVGDTLSLGRDVHDFFVFDLSGITRTITAAKLALTLPSAAGYNSGDPSENFELHDVTTSIPMLINGTGGVAAYADLGSGTVFGSRTITRADSGTVVEITLNSSGIAALDAAPGFIALGGSLTTLDAATNNEFIFGNTHLVETITQLRLALGHVPPGNFNDDKAVDAADYVAWRKSNGTQSDYSAWRANFGTVVATGASNIPEPAAALLLAAAAVTLFGQRKRRF